MGYALDGRRSLRQVDRIRWEISRQKPIVPLADIFNHRHKPISHKGALLLPPSAAIALPASAGYRFRYP